MRGQEQAIHCMLKFKELRQSSFYFVKVFHTLLLVQDQKAYKGSDKLLSWLTPHGQLFHWNHAKLCVARRIQARMHANDNSFLGSKQLTIALSSSFNQLLYWLLKFVHKWNVYEHPVYIEYWSEWGKSFAAVRITQFRNMCPLRFLSESVAPGVLPVAAATSTTFKRQQKPWRSMIS